MGKENSKVAKAGGVSMIALTLAACGDEDTTPFLRPMLTRPLRLLI